MYRNGDLDLDRLLTATYLLAELETVLESMQDGDAIHSTDTFHCPPLISS